MPTNKRLAFRPREFKGSRLRCLLLTHRSKKDVAAFLHSLVSPVAGVTEKDVWMPDGLCQPDEAKLGESCEFLTPTHRALITDWWLANKWRANTPNWDIVASATFSGSSGLLLVEAKAHEDEFADDRCGATNKANYAQIEREIKCASDGLNNLCSGFNLSTTSYYQLSNRFAFAWKLASLKIPVALVYLGFVQATEMEGRKLFRDHEDWKKCVLNRSSGVIPEAAWKGSFKVGDTPLVIRIRSAEVRVDANVLTEPA